MTGECAGAPGRWTPVTTADGSVTLRSEAWGEACHDLAGAWTESHARYAEPAGLRARAASGELERVRLLDVGTGLGWNLAAALAALAGTGARLDAVGLEIDPGVIEATLALARVRDLGPGAAGRAHRPVLEALREALGDPDRAARAGVPLGGEGRLRLRIGDARETVRGLAPDECFDAVFLDPFSRATDPGPWQGEFVRALAARLAPGGRLATYSAALDLRVELAAAGLNVGRGPRVAGKIEGTVAGRGFFPEPLEARTARKLRRRLERK